MKICKDSFYHLLKAGSKGSFIVQDCSCTEKGCQLPNEDDMETLVKAYEFYDFVSCIIVEGVEFCTKSQMFDAIYDEFYKKEKR